MPWGTPTKAHLNRPGHLKCLQDFLPRNSHLQLYASLGSCLSPCTTHSSCKRELILVLKGLWVSPYKHPSTEVPCWTWGAIWSQSGCWESCFLFQQSELFLFKTMCFQDNLGTSDCSAGALQREDNRTGTAEMSKWSDLLQGTWEASTKLSRNLILVYKTSQSNSEGRQKNGVGFAVPFPKLDGHQQIQKHRRAGDKSLTQIFSGHGALTVSQRRLWNKGFTQHSQ